MWHVLLPPVTVKKHLVDFESSRIDTITINSAGRILAIAMLSAKIYMDRSRLMPRWCSLMACPFGSLQSPCECFASRSARAANASIERQSGTCSSFQ